MSMDIKSVRTVQHVEVDLEVDGIPLRGIMTYRVDPLGMGYLVKLQLYSLETPLAQNWVWETSNEKAYPGSVTIGSLRAMQRFVDDTERVKEIRSWLGSINLLPIPQGSSKV